MQPTLNSGVTSQTQVGDTIYVNRFSTYKSGDIVIANVPWWDDPVIKRLVGCPGDKIQIRDEDGVYKLYCNDKVLYTKEKTDYSLHGYKNRGTNYLFNTIYNSFINNTVAGKDFSANIGELNGEKCIQLNENEYFLMGDNWGESDDCLKFGPAVYKNLDGRVDYVVPLGENTFSYLCNFIYEMIFTKQNNFKY